MRLSKYPKKGMSWAQVEDEKKLVKYRKKHNIKKVCPNCKNEDLDKFFIDTLGIEHCSKCFYPLIDLDRIVWH